MHILPVIELFQAVIFSLLQPVFVCHMVSYYCEIKDLISLIKKWMCAGLLPFIDSFIHENDWKSMRYDANHY